MSSEAKSTVNDWRPKPRNQGTANICQVLHYGNLLTRHPVPVNRKLYPHCCPFRTLRIDIVLMRTAMSIHALPIRLQRVKPITRHIYPAQRVILRSLTNCTRVSAVRRGWWAGNAWHMPWRHGVTLTLLRRTCVRQLKADQGLRELPLSALISNSWIPHAGRLFEYSMGPRVAKPYNTQTGSHHPGIHRPPRPPSSRRASPRPPRSWAALAPTMLHSCFGS